MQLQTQDGYLQLVLRLLRVHDSNVVHGEIDVQQISRRSLRTIGTVFLGCGSWLLPLSAGVSRYNTSRSTSKRQSSRY